MGADGHIRIMDAEKLIADKGLSEERFQQFMSTIAVGHGGTYLQKLSGHRYVSDYFGDNPYTDSILSKFMLYGFDSDKWEAWDLRFLNKKILKHNFTQEEFTQLVEYLFKNCYVAEWEVWT